jgi:putative transposase
MARMARVVAPGFPHHVTQRGNRNQNVFFSDEDRRTYLELIRRHAQASAVEIWAYCIMDNHVHFVAVPQREDSLTRCFQEAHRLYTRRINFRKGWKGYLWQGRFASFPMDERYLYAAVRYVERNPVKARLVDDPWEYSWSSARAHVLKTNDPLLSHCFLNDEIQDWKTYLANEDLSMSRDIETGIRVGRPQGSDQFIGKLERMLGRRLRKEKPGPKPATVGLS